MLYVFWAPWAEKVRFPLENVRFPMNMCVFLWKMYFSLMQIPKNSKLPVGTNHDTFPGTDPGTNHDTFPGTHTSKDHQELKECNTT